MFRKTLIYCAIAAALFSSRQAHGQGIVIPWAGPVNSGMGGASTAAPLDATGATYWNPATASALTNELSVGVGVLLPIVETRSSVVGLGAGTTNGEPGTQVLPTVGFVHRAEGSSVTFSLGVNPIGGFGTNYPSSNTNPLFTPQSNAPMAPGGLGAVFTRAMYIQIAPSITWALDEKLSVSFGPTITTAEVVIDPLLAGPFNDADASGQPRYGSGRGTRFGWGGGVQAGIYYIGDNCWHYGASIKSPQWMEDFRVQSTDELGRPTVARFQADLPMIISLGTAYRGIEDVVFALDVRYFDYSNTAGLGDRGFAANGALNGLNMSSIVSAATGIQVRMSESLYVRAGYVFNQSPMQDGEAMIGVAAPLYYQHTLNGGFSFALSENCWVNASYSYIPKAELTGPILTALGPVPGSSITTEEQVHHGSVGVTVKY